MKLSFILLLITFLQVSADGLSQTVSISGNHLSLRKVLKDIQKQTGYDYILTKEQLSESRHLNLDLDKVSVEEALKSVFAGQPLDFRLLNKTIVVNKRKEEIKVPVLESISEDEAPQIRITGKVTDANTGDPLAGVTIRVKGTTTGAVTDGSGNFNIEADDEAVLEVSFVGYTPKEISVAGKTTVDISLEASATGLDQLVVVGFGTQKKKNLTGGVDQINSERINKFQQSDLGKALAGEVPNLQIDIADGTPGREAKFNLRGVTSISGGTPLILLDGVPISNSELNNIPPQSIDNISFLKDASSAAIYGARAAYGVILVQTKKGVEGKLRINYSNNFKWGKATRIPHVYKGLDYLDIQTNEFNRNINQEYYTKEQVEYPHLAAEDPTLPRQNYTTIGGNPVLLSAGPPTNYYVEWFEKYSPSQNHNLNLSGGGKTYKYFFGLDYNYEEGGLNFKPNKVNRYNLRANNTFDISSKISLFFNSSLTVRRDNLPNTFLYNFMSNPWRYIENSNPFLPEYIELDDGTVIPTDLGFYKDFVSKQSSYDVDIFNVLNMIGGDFKIVEKEDSKISLHGDISYKYNQNYTDRWFDNTGPYLSQNFNNRNTILPFYSDAAPAKVIKNNLQNNDININVFGTYQRTIRRQTLDLTGGMTFERFRQHGENLEHQEPVGGLGQHSINLASGIFAGSDSDDKFANRSFFLRANYNFNERYLVELNGMHNTSSRFRSGQRGALFGSVSGAWRISEEEFFRSNWIGNLKIRASFGSLGNQDIGSFDYLPNMVVSRSPYTLDGEQYTYTTFPQPISQNFTWETSKTLDFGVDFSAFHNKLDFTFDWYQRNTNRMLVPGHALPSVFGANVPKENNGSLQNRGWEATLSYRDEVGQSKDFSYGVRLNISDSRAIVTDYLNPTNFLGDFYKGEVFGEIWGLTTLGFFKSDEEAKSSPVLNSSGYKQFVSEGTIKFEDKNNDGVIDKGKNTLDNPGDYRIIGNSTPRYIFGLNLDVNYKEFGLSALFKGVGKRDVYPGPEATNFWSSYNRKYQVLLDEAVKRRWTKDNPDSYFPKPQGYIALAGNDLGEPQTRYLQNAAFVRLSNLIFSYSIPQKMLKNHFQNIRIYFNATNIFEFTKLDSTLDPEGLEKDPDGYSGNLGIGTAYPIQRTYSFGIEVGL